MNPLEWLRRKLAGGGPAENVSSPRRFGPGVRYGLPSFEEAAAEAALNLAQPQGPEWLILFQVVGDHSEDFTRVRVDLVGQEASLVSHSGPYPELEGGEVVRRLRRRARPLGQEDVRRLRALLPGDPAEWPPPAEVASLGAHCDLFLARRGAATTWSGWFPAADRQHFAHELCSAVADLVPKEEIDAATSAAIVEERERPAREEAERVARLTARAAARRAAAGSAPPPAPRPHRGTSSAQRHSAQLTAERAAAVLRSADDLSREGRLGKAQKLYRQLIARYPRTDAAAEAERRLTRVEGDDSARSGTAEGPPAEERGPGGAGA